MSTSNDTVGNKTVIGDNTYYETSSYFGDANRHISDHIGTPLKCVTIKVFTTNYTSGGISINPTLFGFETILTVLIEPQGYYSVVYDRTTEKIKYLHEVSGTFIEATDGDDLSNYPTRITLMGY